MKKVSYGFITITRVRTHVTLSNGSTAVFPHYPNGVESTEATIKEARVWTAERAEDFEVRDER